MFTSGVNESGSASWALSDPDERRNSNAAVRAEAAVFAKLVIEVRLVGRWVRFWSSCAQALRRSFPAPLSPQSGRPAHAPQPSQPQPSRLAPKPSKLLSHHQEDR